MSNPKYTIFKTDYSIFTTAKPAAIWRLWSTVEHWSLWDKGLQSCKLIDEFKENGKALLLPHGAPEPIEIKFINVIPEFCFSDVANLPFGKIQTEHNIIKNDSDGIYVKHSVVATIELEQANFFEKEIWSHMEAGLPDAVNKLVALAEK